MEKWHDKNHSIPCNGRYVRCSFGCYEASLSCAKAYINVIHIENAHIHAISTVQLISFALYCFYPYLEFISEASATDKAFVF